MERLKYYEGKFRAADKVTVIYQFIIAVIIIFNYKHIPFHRSFITLHFLLIIALGVLPFLKSNPVVNWLRIWNQIFILPFNFFELHFLVHNVHPKDMDAILIRIDHFLFGVNPTIWLEKIQWPVLTEYLQLAYSSFYFLPLILFILLYRWGRMESFDYFAFIIVYGFYLSYLGYFLVPALGPRFALADLHNAPLKGLWLTTHLQNLLNSLENVQRDAFPSGHTAMTVLTMYFAAKYAKKYFYVLLIIGSSLIFATVYLRYHYVIDVIAGFVLAYFVVVTGPLVYRWLNALQLVPYGRLKNVAGEQ